MVWLRREVMALAVIQLRLTMAEASLVSCVYAKIIAHWIERFRKAVRQGMLDRSLGPHQWHWPTDTKFIETIIELYRLHLGGQHMTLQARISAVSENWALRNASPPQLAHRDPVKLVWRNTR